MGRGTIGPIDGIHLIRRSINLVRPTEIKKAHLGSIVFSIVVPIPPVRMIIRMPVHRHRRGV